MRPPARLTIASTPDSDDAFALDAIEQGLVTLPGHALRLVREPMARLNRASLDGHYEVTAVSAVAYPAVAGRYAVLSVGTSVGRGYGPVLVSREHLGVADLAGRRVGVPGVPTTGWFLFKRLCPAAVAVEMPFDEIADAVAAGDLDAGVMIHEELLYYPRLGLRTVVDLGAAWCGETGLPLPVGLNLVRRDLGPAVMGGVCAALADSLRHAREHPDAALARVSRFGRGAAGGVTGQFVRMFANEDSAALAADVRAALGVLFAQAVALGLAAAVPPLDVVEPARVYAARVPR